MAKPSKFDKVVTTIKGYKAKADKFYKDNPEVSKAVETAVGAGVGNSAYKLLGSGGKSISKANKIRLMIQKQKNAVSEANESLSSLAKTTKTKILKTSKPKQKIELVKPSPKTTETLRYKDKLKTIENKGSENPDDFGWKTINKSRKK